MRIVLLVHLHWSLFFVIDAVFKADSDCLFLDANETKLMLTQCENHFFSVCRRFRSQEILQEVFFPNVKSKFSSFSVHYAGMSWSITHYYYEKLCWIVYIDEQMVHFIKYLDCGSFLSNKNRISVPRHIFLTAEIYLNHF